MPDIRNYRAILDDFHRDVLPEHPVLNTPRHPWHNNEGFIGFNMFINVLESFQGDGEGLAICRWAANPQSGEAEVWARLASSGYNFPFGTRMALIDYPALVGYQVLATGGFNWILRRYTGGGAFVDITPPGLPAFPDYPTAGELQMLRLTPTDVEVWTTVGSDGLTWTLQFSVADSTYRTDLYPWLGATGNEDGWGEMGGPPITWVPQIYRRPNE